jgi:hypothetical protein
VIMRIEFGVRHLEAAVLRLNEVNSVVEIAERHAGFVSRMARNESFTRIHLHPVPRWVWRVMVPGEHFHVSLRVRGINPASITAPGIVPRALRAEHVRLQ